MASPACSRYSGLAAISSVEIDAMADVRAVMVLLPCCRGRTGRGAGHGVRGTRGIGANLSQPFSGVDTRGAICTVPQRLGIRSATARGETRAEAAVARGSGLERRFGRRVGRQPLG